MSDKKSETYEYMNQSFTLKPIYQSVKCVYE